ncbi:MAG: RNA polymerase sigma factor [Acidimicrobiales bacterium]
MDAAGVYLRYAPAVRGYLRGRGVADADDLLSEVFLQVARSLPRFRGDEDHLRAWVFTIARNRVVDGHRRRSTRPMLADVPVPERAAPAHEDPVDPELLGALAQLTPDQREVVVLRFVADLPLEEVASITGRTEGAVKSMQHRALAQLARILVDPVNADNADG